MIDYLRRLCAHLAWADERVLTSLLGAPAPPVRALQLYAHVLGAEHVWLSRLQREQATVAVWPTLSLEECGTLARRNHGALDAFMGSLSAADLEREIPYVNSAGASFLSRVDDILAQITTHGVYHRGQIALLVRDSGAEPAPTDYIAFVRGVPAATRQPVSKARE
jgi:uncharacterized damage-inducible protein DinB